VFYLIFKKAVQARMPFPQDKLQMATGDIYGVKMRWRQEDFGARTRRGVLSRINENEILI